MAKFLAKIFSGIGDWGLGIGDWGLGIGDWAQSPIHNPQSPSPGIITLNLIKKYFYYLILMEFELNNIFDEEFKRIAEEKKYIVLSDVLKISLLDDNNEYKINLAHIRKYA